MLVGKFTSPSNPYLDDPTANSWTMSATAFPVAIIAVAIWASLFSRQEITLERAWKLCLRARVCEGLARRRLHVLALSASGFRANVNTDVASQGGTANGNHHVRAWKLESPRAQPLKVFSAGVAAAGLAHKKSGGDGDRRVLLAREATASEDAYERAADTHSLLHHEKNAEDAAQSGEEVRQPRNAYELMAASFITGKRQQAAEDQAEEERKTARLSGDAAAFNYHPHMLQPHSPSHAVLSRWQPLPSPSNANLAQPAQLSFALINNSHRRSDHALPAASALPPLQPNVRVKLPPLHSPKSLGASLVERGAPQSDVLSQ